MPPTPADEAKARKLANYDRQIEQLERKLDKLVERRRNFIAGWRGLGASVNLPDNFDPLRAVEDWLIKYGVSPAEFGRTFFNDPRFVFDLRNGRKPRELNLRRVWHITRKPPRKA